MESKYSILITGAGGFIGQALAAAFANDPLVEAISLTDIVAPTVPQSIQNGSAVKVDSFAADLTARETCESVLRSNFTHIYLLHGIMSGAAEANLDLGLRVNIDSMRYITDTLRSRESPIPVRVVFPSSLAVFGPAQENSVITETTIPFPQSSYGAEKAIVELLLNDLSRRGLIDARIVRLPTIIVRPGKPTGAASSFFSGIIREPLNGVDAEVPVSRDLKAWVCSERTVIRNLVVARDVPTEAFGQTGRVVNLPGITVTVQQMLDALEQVGGRKALQHIRDVYDDNVARIVGSWPADFDTSKAKQLGFRDDVALEQIIQDYVEDYMS